MSTDEIDSGTIDWKKKFDLNRLDQLDGEHLIGMIFGVLLLIHKDHPLVKFLVEKLLSDAFSSSEGIREILKVMDALGIEISNTGPEGKS